MALGPDSHDVKTQELVESELLDGNIQIKFHLLQHKEILGDKMIKKGGWAFRIEQ